MELTDTDLNALIGVLDFIKVYTNIKVEPLPLDEYEQSVFDKLKAEKKRRKEEKHANRDLNAGSVDVGTDRSSPDPHLHSPEPSP